MRSDVDCLSIERGSFQFFCIFFSTCSFSSSKIKRSLLQAVTESAATEAANSASAYYSLDLAQFRKTHVRCVSAHPLYRCGLSVGVSISTTIESPLLKASLSCLVMIE
jgi:hypothetical protein